MFDNNDGRVRGRRGQRIRAMWLQQHPLCVMCQAENKVVMAEEVDHIQPLSQGGTDDDLNRQSLCRPHHREKTSREAGDGGRYSIFPEWLRPALGHLTIVCGPPGSGKSTYVAQNAKPDDLVIDLDEIVAEQTGKPIYHSDDIGPALRHRNHQLGELSRTPRTAWLIVSGMKSERAWWSRKLMPTQMVVMPTSLQLCIARVNSDMRRPAHVKTRQIKYIEQWFVAKRGLSVAAKQPKRTIGVSGWPIDA